MAKSATITRLYQHLHITELHTPEEANNTIKQESPPEIFLDWEAPIIANRKRTRQWYIVASLIMAVVIVHSLYIRSWSTILITLLICGLYAFLHDKTPPRKHIQITSNGILFDDHFLRWSQMKQFWIVSAHHEHMLHIRTRGGNKNIRIMVEHKDPNEIRLLLARFIPENTEKQENLFDLIIRICNL